MDSQAKNESFELDILEMSDKELSGFEIVDIREPGEDRMKLLSSLLRRDICQMPLSTFDQQNPQLDKSKRYLFVCQRGMRSARLTEALRQRGFENVYSLHGGVEAVRRKYIA